MFKLEFTFATWQEAQAAMALMSGHVEAPAPAPAVKAEAKKVIEKAKEATPAPKPAPAPEKPAPTPPVSETATAAITESVVSEPVSASPSEPAPAFTLEQVRAKLAELSQAGKRDQVMAIISAQGVAKLTDIPPAKYPAVMAKAEELAA